MEGPLMSLRVYIEPGPGIEVRGRRFHLFADSDGFYPLPAVGVQADPGRGGAVLWDWGVHVDPEAPTALKQWLEAYWPAPRKGRLEMAGTRRLSEQDRIPPNVIHPGWAGSQPAAAAAPVAGSVPGGPWWERADGPAGADTRPSAYADVAVGVVWRIVHEENGRAVSVDRTFELVFVPIGAPGRGAGEGESGTRPSRKPSDDDGTPPSDPIPQPRAGTEPVDEDALAAEAQLPPKLRRLTEIVDEQNRVVSPLNAFAAIDFGTAASTVTLHDSRNVRRHRVDPSQARALHQEFHDLLDAEPPAALKAEWATAVEAIAARVGAALPRLGIDGVDALRSRLEAGARPDNDDASLIDVVGAAVEEEYGSRGQALRHWLAGQVHAAYDRSFAVPALDWFSLQLTNLGGVMEPTQLDSVIRIDNRNPLQITVGGSDRPGAGPDDVIRGVKNRLGDPEPVAGAVYRDGRSADTDGLVAMVYHQLAERTEKFAARGRTGPVQPLDRAVITTPTVMPPSARARLRDMVKYCLDLALAETRFDEGVAAALFFLMRDFGHDPALGVEVLRARSRKVAESPPTWKQNMLVIDIGGGTTDIALIEVQLVDRTPEIPGCDPAVQGRFYEVRPELRGSTGHRQLGGNYLTLRVLYWIKARIVDGLLARQPDLAASLPPELRGADGSVRSLAADILDQPDVQEPARLSVRKALTAILPTNWATNPGSRDASRRLWDLAEDAKKTLGTGTDVTIKSEDVRGLITALAAELHKVKVDVFDPVVLTSGDFERVARPVLDQAVEIANSQIETWQRRADPKDRIDRVLLSGRTTAMPLMAQAVTEGIGRTDDGRMASVAPGPGGVVTEYRFAKEAASIGAAWAHAHYEFNPLDLDRAKPRMERGTSIVVFHVRNLFATLPCDFKLKGVGQVRDILLSAGDRLLFTGGEPLPVARGDWLPLLPNFEVHRPVHRNQTIIWGVFNLDRQRRKERFDPDPSIWLGDLGHRTHHGVYARLQIHQDLTPTLLLCYGPPHYVLPPDDIGTSENLADFLATGGRDADGRRITTRDFTLHVSCRPERDGDPDTAEVRFWPASAAGDGNAMFPSHFHATDELGRDSVRGALSTSPLPHPPDDRTWTFLLRTAPGGRLEPVAHLDVPGGWTEQADFFASLAEDGMLRVHRGEPPYLRASSMREVEEYPGAVQRFDMDPGEADVNKLWDPFNGEH
jgi:hypothetical protein